ncbi:hypothetical protein [Actinophytocola xinjiangensis]|uniref:hypothetical protein n=1 Tax=Actinophytocola xinjiangensis TaxID=485602 RepID=UPI0012B6B8F6|nr:hypothetical protein [Actinophytocola xinjiangensis]
MTTAPREPAAVNGAGHPVAATGGPFVLRAARSPILGYSGPAETGERITDADRLRTVRRLVRQLGGQAPPPREHGLRAG